MRTAAQVLVFPDWRENPFLNLLSLAPRTAGYRFRGAVTLDGLCEQLAGLRRDDVVHFHWTSPLLQEAGTAAEARARLDRLARALRGAGRRGVRLVWTVHNRLPHELRHRGAEIALYRLLAGAADAIHVMAPDTADVVSDVVALDAAKVRVIPHPSYEGIYDTAVSRSTAREAFGLGERDLAVLFLGQIRPYKGVDALVDAAARAGRDDGEVVLLLAGVVKGLSEDEFLGSLPPVLRTVTSFGYVPDDEIARWLRAADVAIFPYRTVLNSGSVHLAATFRVPVVLPDEEHLRRQFGGQRWAAFFDPSRPADSIAALLGDESLFAGLADEDFARFTAPITPWRVSRDYRRLLDELTDR
jgi:glycosyltransferase involved in cell wall biosynthesis